MVRFFVNVVSGTSVNEVSKAAKASCNTGEYWLRKAFVALEGWQDGLRLSGDVYIDEKYVAVSEGDVVFGKGGRKLRGLSKNRRCVALGMCKGVRVAIVEGKGKSSSADIVSAFGAKIAPGSRLIHDCDWSHKRLVAGLSLIDDGHKAVYRNSQVKELEPINKYCSLLASYLRLHRGLDKKRLQGWLNLFAFSMAAEKNDVQKAYSIVLLLIKTNKVLRYRDKL